MASPGLSERRPRRGLPAAPKLEMPELPGEASPFLRPRRRMRVRRARRGWQQWLLGLQAAGLLLAAVGLLLAGYRRVMHSQSLRVKAVQVRGNHFLSEGEVRELLGPADGANILSLDIGDLKRRLRASPWLEDASVQRTLPDTLLVQVRERRPLALAELDGLYLMDARGDLIDLYGARTAVYDLPIVRGLAGLSDEQRRARAERAARLLEDIGELQAELSEIEVEAGGDLRLVLRRGAEVLRLGEPPYRAALAAFLELRRELTERCPRAEYFDLRFRGRIFAREPAPAEGTPGTAPPAPRSASPGPLPERPGPAPPVLQGARTTTGAGPLRPPEGRVRAVPVVRAGAEAPTHGTEDGLERAVAGRGGKRG